MVGGARGPPDPPLDTALLAKGRSRAVVVANWHHTGTSLGELRVDLAAHVHCKKNRTPNFEESNNSKFDQII